MEVNQGYYFNQYQMDDFKMMNLVAQKYPGKLVDIDGDEFCVSTMVKQLTF